MDFIVYKCLLKKIGLNTPDQIKSIKYRTDNLKESQSLISKILTIAKFCLKFKSMKTELSNNIIISPKDDSFNYAKEFLSTYNHNGSVYTHYYFDLLYNNCTLSFFKKLKLKIYFILMMILSLCDKKSSVSTLMFIHNIIYTFTSSDKNKKIYIYGRLYHLDYYFAAIILSSYLKYNVTYILGSSLIWGGKKYSYLPEISLIASSKVQIEELKGLKKLNFFVYKDLIYWKKEICEDSSNIKYDIGFYFSGNWARKDGMYRDLNINMIREYKYLDNEYYRISMNILEYIVENNNNKKFVFYLHPYEKFLFETYNISPPYLCYLNEHNIDFNLNSKLPMSNMLECKIGISLSSAIAYERLDLGLDSFIYYKKEWDELNPDILGKYKKYIYYSPEDLNKKLNEITQLNSK